MAEQSKVRIVNPTRRVLKVALGLVVFLILLVIVRIQLRPIYHSPATRQRPHIYEYSRAMDSNVVTSGPFDVTVSSFTVTTNGHYMDLQRTRRKVPADQPAGSTAFHWANANSQVQVPGLSVKLKRIGMAYSTNALAVHPSAPTRLTASFFTPALKPYDEGVLLAELPAASDRELAVVWYFPEVCLDFEIQGTSVKLVDLRLFDARTGRSIGLPDSTPLSSGEIRVSAQAKMWHASPVLLVMDIATETFRERIPLQPGASFHVGDVSGQVVFVGDSTRPEVQMHGPVNGRFILRPATNHSFVCLHTANPGGWRKHDLTYIPATGTPFPVTAEDWFHDLQIVKIPRSVTPGDQLEISHPARRSRLIFQLPKLPGLPSANRNVRNLFAVRVPYARFETPSDHMDFVLGVTQLRRDEKHPLGPIGLVGYPREYTNATPAQMLHDYSNLIPAVGSLEVNEPMLQVQWSVPDLRRILREWWDELRSP